MFTLDVVTHFNKRSHKYIIQDSSEIFGQYMNIRQVRVSSRVKNNFTHVERSLKTVCLIEVTK